MNDLVVYDTEATDADPRHGQITQFGGIRADAAMNPLEELELRVRRLPWVVPMPKALEVTRMRAEDLSGPGRISEYEASREIERFLVPGYGSPRTMLTFNGIRFDDELIRTTLFRNLRNPWFSSGRQTTRIDLLSVVQLAHACEPGSITVPNGDDGRLTWRLERLCPANGIEMHAHDALGDARATLELAKLVVRRAPSAWATARACGLPSKVESLLAGAAGSGRPVYLFTHFGEAAVIPCAVIGSDGKKRWILADLRADGRPSDAAGISGSMYSRGTPYPVIRSNAAPLLLDAATAMRLAPEIDPASIAAKAMTIKLNAEIRQNALRALSGSSFTELERPTSEERIYGGFVPDSDKPSMTAFHRADDWESRISVPFADPRLKDFAARIIVDAARNREAFLPEGVVAQLEGECSEVLQRPHAGEGARWGTVARALAEGADADWREWAETAFGIPSAYEACTQAPGPDAPLQLEMF